MPRSLFRKEAIDAQREKFLGEASLAQPMRMWIYTATAVAVAVIVVAVAVWGQYTRRERVQGYLSSATGAAVVRMPDSGTIAELMIKEGDVVTSGAPLARLTVDKSGVNDVRGNEAVMRELETRKTLLEQERAQAESLGQQQVVQLKQRVTNLQGDVQQADIEISLQNERLASARSIAKLWKDLQGQQYASDIYIQQKQDDAKEQEIKVQQLKSKRAVIEGNLATARADIPEAQSRTRTQLQQIDQRTSQVTQGIAEQVNSHEQSIKRDMMITAPIDGTVTNIGPARGQTVAADTQLATLLPKDSLLHAEMLVPTRAIGFIHAGQDVTLRYEAFPYERFGQYHGHVESVGKTIWTQGELVGPLSVREPVYRIIVVLDRQDIKSGDDAFPLRAGMVASADLLMERRTLLEWLFQPVLQLRKRMQSGPQAAA